MARSHHRKKHKQHLQQFKHTQELGTDVPKNKINGTWVFAIAGAIVGIALSYFPTAGNILWTIVGLIVGGIAGYFIGRKIDEGKN